MCPMAKHHVERDDGQRVGIDRGRIANGRLTRNSTAQIAAPDCSGLESGREQADSNATGC
jgi:hypothetical protein